MPDTIRICIKRPDVAVEAIDVPNTIEALQELVGGYIEVISLFPNIVVSVNEEGTLKGMPFNMVLAGHWLRGPVLFAGVKGEEFTHAPFHNVNQVESFIRRCNRR
ncbi:MAG: DUF3846 domain-containing protein [Clostridia bacterium]|nr:DUF3846 domain-containing protein [Clostridia bacterium]